MDPSVIFANLLSPSTLFFFLGFAAVLVKSDLEIPHPLPRLFSLYLLMSIGYQGGAKLAAAGLSGQVLLYVGGGMLMALAIPFAAFFVLRRILGTADAAAMAATYGSISVVTFIVGTDFLTRAAVPFGGYMVAIMSLMETPAIVAGILLWRLFGPSAPAGAATRDWRRLAHESVFNGTVYLLLGSLLIGFITGPTSAKALAPFTVDLFKGMVLFFLLDTGMLAARKARQLIEVGPKLVAFGIGAPLVHGAAGMLLAYLMGMSQGDALLFTVLSASSSYIVVPAAMRTAIPDANPGLFELLSLSVTFPFNVVVGLPLYFSVIQRVWA